MHFSGTVKNLKGEGIKGATVDVVSHDSWHLRHFRPLTISTVASRRRRCLRHPVPRPRRAERPGQDIGQPRRHVQLSRYPAHCIPDCARVYVLS